MPAASSSARKRSRSASASSASGSACELREHAPAFEVELRDLVEHVVAQLDHLARLVRDVDRLGVIGDVSQIPGDG